MVPSLVCTSKKDLELGDLPEHMLDLIIATAIAPLKQSPCQDFYSAIKQHMNIQLVCKRWRDALQRSGPLAVSVHSKEQLNRLATCSTFAVSELEVEGQSRGIQQATEKLLEAEAFQRTSGQTLRRIFGKQSSAIPARFLVQSAKHFPNLQCLDGLWGIPRRGLPASISQLGLLDTMHYVGYEMVEVGAAFQALQKLQVLSLRGVAVDLLQLPSSLQVLLVCDCRVSGADESRLREQKGVKAGRYNVYVAGGSQGGTVRLLMHFYNGFPASWEQFY